MELQILDREQVKHRFTDVAVRFEQAMSKISFDELDVSEEIKEQVNNVCKAFFLGKLDTSNSRRILHVSNFVKVIERVQYHEK